MALLLSYDDTCRMLLQTIVQYNGRLTYVEMVDHDLNAIAVDAETGERFRFLADFDKIDNPKDGRLGYVNRPHSDALYIVRTAARMYKMGYTMDNLWHLRGARGEAQRLLVRMGGILEGLNDCYKNNFPSFTEAYAIAKEEERLVAYDRSFAVSNRGIVFYQCHKVGHATSMQEDGIRWTEKGLLASFIRQRPKLNWR